MRDQGRVNCPIATLAFFIMDEKMRDGPAFQLFAADFYMDTLEWTVGEVGQFIRYLFKLWEDKQFDELEEYFFIGQVYRGRCYRKSLPPSTKKQILAVGECLFCGSTENLTVDDIKPYSKGKTHDSFNLQCLCGKCNRLKYDKYDG